VLVVAFVEGTLLAFFNLAELGAIGQVVPPARLGEAVAVEQARVFGTTLAGPPLGGALFGLTRALPFLGDAISYALSVVSLAFMRTPFQETRTEPSAHWRTEVAERLPLAVAERVSANVRADLLRDEPRVERGAHDDRDARIVDRHVRWMIWGGELAGDEIRADPGGHRAQERLFPTAREFEQESLVGNSLCSSSGSKDERARGAEEVRRVRGLEDAHDQDGDSLDLACRGEVRRKGIYFGREKLADVSLWVRPPGWAETDRCPVVCDTEKEPAAEAVCEGSHGATDAVVRDRPLSLNKEILTVRCEPLERGFIEIGHREAADAIEHH
jgi:hypothetical protein